MKFIICNDMTEFESINATATAEWNLIYPNGTCTQYAIPRVNFRDGAIAIPVNEDLHDTFSPLSARWVDLPFDWMCSFDDAIQAGYDTGHGFRLSLKEDDRNTLASYHSMIKEGIDRGDFVDTMELPVWDITSVKHMLSVKDLQDTLYYYGLYYLDLRSKQ